VSVVGVTAPLDANSWHRGRSRSLAQVNDRPQSDGARSESVALLFSRTVRASSPAGRTMGIELPGSQGSAGEGESAIGCLIGQYRAPVALCVQMAPGSLNESVSAGVVIVMGRSSVARYGDGEGGLDETSLVRGGHRASAGRRDGTTQLTAGARHLYTFVADSPGQVNGNGFQDQFGGRHFTWHAVLSSGAIALPAAQPTAKAPVQSTSRSYGSPY
jgi:hypothetical protein